MEDVGFVWKDVVFFGKDVGLVREDVGFDEGLDRILDWLERIMLD